MQVTSFEIPALFELLWKDYANINPHAQKIRRLFEEQGERVANDHVAFRTFEHPSISIEALAEPFVRGGYEARGEYTFESKRLRAVHFEHEDPEFPKVFISALQVEDLAPASKRIVTRLIEQGEKAAWLSAFGFRANHFTVSVNALKELRSIQKVNEFLLNAGYQLNEEGGAIKGSPDQFLEQSSVLASNVEVEFSDGEYVVPGCYYEFARRYAQPDGRLYGGFITASADRIFESTDRGQ